MKPTGTRVEVLESTERWSEINLADGSRLRVKMAVSMAWRHADQHDAEGMPVYTLQMTPVTSVVDAPPGLRK